MPCEVKLLHVPMALMNIHGGLPYVLLSSMSHFNQYANSFFVLLEHVVHTYSLQPAVWTGVHRSHQIMHRCDLYDPLHSSSACFCTAGFFTSSSSISCNTSLTSSNDSNQEWWTLADCTNPVLSTNGDSGPPMLLIYSRRIASQAFNLIAGFGYVMYFSIVGQVCFHECSENGCG